MPLKNLDTYRVLSQFGHQRSYSRAKSYLVSPVDCRNGFDGSQGRQSSSEDSS